MMRQFGGEVGDDALLVSAAKGIENETLLLMSEVIEDVLGPGVAGRCAYLSGPSFAREVANELPTAVTVAAEDDEVARAVQELFRTDYFRVYTIPDVVGVELGGALKNVIALAAGVSDGLGFGHNARAALINRGLVEMARLGAAKGAQAETFAGLAGMGDLIATCMSKHSRNRHVGEQIGKGRKLRDVLAEMVMVAEGVATTKSVHDLAHKHSVELPIANEVYEVLFEDKDPILATSDLMTRQAKDEH